MSWNNGAEKAKFIAQQRKQAEEYRKLGMSEEQIQAMHELDLEQFNSDRRFYSNTQELSAGMFEAGEMDDGKSTLFDKFMDELSVTDDNSPEHSRFWWVEEIEDPDLASRVKMLTSDELELITMHVYEGYTQKDLSDHFGVTQQAVCKKLRRIKKFLGVRL